MCHSSGKCVNPKNVAESAEDKEEREAWVEGKLNKKESEVEKLIQLATRAAVAAAMDIDTPKRG